MLYYLHTLPSAPHSLTSYALQQQSFAVECFSSEPSLRHALSRQLPSLLLLETELDEALHLLRTLRAEPATRALPILVLSADDSEYARVITLDSGADDCLSTPPSMLELAARIRAVLRRSQREQPQDYTLGALHVSPTRHEVTVSGVSVSLTNKEFSLLCLLLENEGLVLPRVTLLDRVWGLGSARDNRTLDVHIRALRRKLGASGEQIQTVRGVGYRITRP